MYRTATAEDLYARMLISLTIQENELYAFSAGKDIRLTIKNYFRDKIKKEIDMEIHFLEKRDNNYYVIASIEIDHNNLFQYH